MWCRRRQNPCETNSPPFDIYSPWEQIMKHLSFQTCRDLAELSATAASRVCGKRLRAADRSVSAACHSWAKARTGSWRTEVYFQERFRKRQKNEIGTSGLNLFKYIFFVKYYYILPLNIMKWVVFLTGEWTKSRNGRLHLTLFLWATSWKNLEILFPAPTCRQAWSEDDQRRSSSPNPTQHASDRPPLNSSRRYRSTALRRRRPAGRQLPAAATSQPIRGGGEKFLRVTLSRVQLQTPLTSNSESPEFDLPLEILPALRLC